MTFLSTLEQLQNVVGIGVIMINNENLDCAHFGNSVMQYESLRDENEFK
jgi:hypothetical protein